MCRAYISKQKSSREKEGMLLMNPYGEGCHYLAVKYLLVLLQGITSKNNGDLLL